MRDETKPYVVQLMCHCFLPCLSAPNPVRKTSTCVLDAASGDSYHSQYILSFSEKFVGSIRLRKKETLHVLTDY